MIIIFFVFLKILNVSLQDIYGFDFEDNKVPKYLTENNGVAEISLKGCLLISSSLKSLNLFSS